jgi:hypothetical protein
MVINGIKILWDNSDMFYLQSYSSPQRNQPEDGNMSGQNMLAAIIK